jgi:enoyl-CoA hydratase
MEMVLTGRFLTAWEAKDYHLINHVTPVELTVEKALDLAETIAGQAPVAVKEAKQAVLQAFEISLSDGLRYERDRWYTLFDTEDQEEGIRAFLEKRDPQWKGQ